MKALQVGGIAAVLLTSALVAGMAIASEGHPTYDLRVRLDIPRAKLIGTPNIDVPERTELSIEAISGYFR